MAKSSWSDSIIFPRCWRCRRICRMESISAGARDDGAGTELEAVGRDAYGALKIKISLK